MKNLKKLGWRTFEEVLPISYRSRILSQISGPRKIKETWPNPPSNMDQNPEEKRRLPNSKTWAQKSPFCSESFFFRWFTVPDIFQIPLISFSSPSSMKLLEAVVDRLLDGTKMPTFPHALDPFSYGRRKSSKSLRFRSSSPSSTPFLGNQRIFSSVYNYYLVV